MNPENYRVPRRQRLLDQNTEERLSNSEPQKPWKYKQPWGLRPDPKLPCTNLQIICLVKIDQNNLTTLTLTVGYVNICKCILLMHTGYQPQGINKPWNLDLNPFYVFLTLLSPPPPKSFKSVRPPFMRNPPQNFGEPNNQ